MKRGELIIAVVIFISLIIPIASANIFSDFWGQITGKATSEPASLTITVGNNAPTIPFVEAITAKDPAELSARSITFYFTAEDSDGAANLDDATAKAYFQKAGEPTRSNESCEAGSTSGNQKNYSCTIDMWYFDEPGSWTINVTIEDINGAHGENSSTTFTYNPYYGMEMSPTALTWPEVGLSATDTGSNNDPILVNNTGNAILEINITGYNLQGVTTLSEYIYANNFTVDNVTSGCSGTAMQNDTSLKVASASLGRGNLSLGDGQETLYFCLKGLPQEISSQEYSTSGTNNWVVEIVY